MLLLQLTAGETAGPTFERVYGEGYLGVSYGFLGRTKKMNLRRHCFEARKLLRAGESLRTISSTSCWLLSLGSCWEQKECLELAERKHQISGNGDQHRYGSYDVELHRHCHICN